MKKNKMTTLSDGTKIDTTHLLLDRCTGCGEQYVPMAEVGFRRMTDTKIIKAQPRHVKCRHDK